MESVGANLMLKRVGIIVAVHWILVGIGILIRGDLTTPIHWFYEPLMLKVFLLLDLPALFLTETLAGPFGPPFDPSVRHAVGQTAIAGTPYSVTALLIVITTLQWALVGVLIDLLIKSFHSVPKGPNRNGAKMP